MTIADLEIKVKSAEEKVEKIKTTREKHLSRLNKKIDALNKLFNEINEDFSYEELNKEENWIAKFYKHPYYNDVANLAFDIEIIKDDIKSNEYKIKEAEQALKNWIEKLNAEKAKQQYIANEIPQEIKDFLLQWKTNIMNAVQKMAEDYITDRDEYRQDKNKIIFEYIQEHKEEYKWVDIYEYNPEHSYESDIHSYKAIKEIQNIHEYIVISEEFNNKYGNPLFKNYKARKFDDEWLEKELTQEMNNRLIDLMNKVSKITGIIKGANLIVNYGDLNGIVYGENGNAKITTIGAGGYNIQIFHYRVLVKEIK